MKKMSITAFILSSVLLFSGCGAMSNESQEYDPENNQGMTTPDQTGIQDRYDYDMQKTDPDQTYNEGSYSADSQKISTTTDLNGKAITKASNNANNVCRRLDGMLGVDEVSCVVSADDCFVSVQMNEKATENQKQAVLRDTYMVCKNTNQTIENVYLNFEAEMHNQIKGYMDQMNTSDSTFSPKISQIKTSMKDVTIR
jgi:PBP1b-binding outer membrane lipoprotein LpoB